MRILLFGVLAEVVGNSIIDMEADDVSSLRERLITKFPSLKNYSFQVAVNQERIETNTSLIEQDEVALLPPFAGG